jgi:hypothetical protein
MIKKYNQFVKGKVNEKFAMDEPPMDEPSMDSMDEPSMEQDSMEEEGGEYMGTQMLQNLADALGTEVVDNSVEHNGKKVNFYSETEMFHVDKKKFDTVEDVVNYVGGETPVNIDEEPIGIDEDEFGDNYGKFESKSYKNSRLKKFKK